MRVGLGGIEDDFQLCHYAIFTEVEAPADLVHFISRSSENLHIWRNLHSAFTMHRLTKERQVTLQGTSRSLWYCLTVLQNSACLGITEELFPQKVILVCFLTQIILGYHPPESTSNYSWVESRLGHC